MGNLKIVLYTHDVEYAEYFSNYVRDPMKNKKLLVKVFTDAQAFYKNTKSQKYQLLLTDQSLEDISEENFEQRIQLSDDQVSTTSQQTPIVFKYQPLNELLSKVLSIYVEQTNKSLSLTEEKTSTITFYSGDSGAGKTILSLCLAKYLATQEKSVFYLNLENIHTTYLFFKEQKPSSFEVFYYLKNDPEKLISKIQSLKSHDAHTNIDYFTLPVLPEEMEMLTAEETQLLIQSIQKTELYDYIIVDLDSSLHERNKGALEACDDVFWILSANEPSLARSKYIIEQNIFDISFDRGKVHYILNKTSQDLFPNFNQYNFSIEEQIPYYSDWLAMNELEKVLSDSNIGEKLAILIEKNIDLLRTVPFLEST